MNTAFRHTSVPFLCFLVFLSWGCVGQTQIGQVTAVAAPEDHVPQPSSLCDVVENSYLAALNETATAHEDEQFVERDILDSSQSVSLSVKKEPERSNEASTGQDSGKNEEAIVEGENLQTTDDLPGCFDEVKATSVPSPNIEVEKFSEIPEEESLSPHHTNMDEHQTVSMDHVESSQAPLSSLEVTGEPKDSNGQEMAEKPEVSSKQGAASSYYAEENTWLPSDDVSEDVSEPLEGEPSFPYPFDEEMVPAVSQEHHKVSQVPFPGFDAIAIPEYAHESELEEEHESSSEQALAFSREPEASAVPLDRFVQGELNKVQEEASVSVDGEKEIASKDLHSWEMRPPMPSSNQSGELQENDTELFNDSEPAPSSADAIDLEGESELTEDEPFPSILADKGITQSKASEFHVIRQVPFPGFEAIEIPGYSNGIESQENQEELDGPKPAAMGDVETNTIHLSKVEPEELNRILAEAPITLDGEVGIVLEEEHSDELTSPLPPNMSVELLEKTSEISDDDDVNSVPSSQVNLDGQTEIQENGSASVDGGVSPELDEDHTNETVPQILAKNIPNASLFDDGQVATDTSQESTTRVAESGEDTLTEQAPTGTTAKAVRGDDVLPKDSLLDPNPSEPSILSKLYESESRTVEKNRRAQLPGNLGSVDDLQSAVIAKEETRLIPKERQPHTNPERSSSIEKKGNADQNLTSQHVTPSERNPENCHRGRVELARHQYQDALLAFSQSIQSYGTENLSVDDVLEVQDCYRQRAYTYLQLNLPRQALSDIDRVLLGGPSGETGKSLDVFFRGRVYAIMNKSQRAINDFSEALELGLPTNDRAYVYYLRGLAYLRLRLIDLGLKDLSVGCRAKFSDACELLDQIL